MKAVELNAINFKDSLEICTDDLEPILMKVLNDLRDKLILLSDEASAEVKLALFKETVEYLNHLDENHTELEDDIMTEEREGLCDALYMMGTIVGLDSKTEYLDKWRDW